MSTNTFPVRLVLAGLLFVAVCAACSLVTSAGAPTCTIGYDGNGNSGGGAPTDGNVYPQGASVAVRGNTGDLVKTGNTFGGWNPRQDGTGRTYLAGATIAAVGANLTLYAVWIAQVSYSGLIHLPATSTPAIDRWYVLVKNNGTGEQFQTRIGTDGSFALSDTRGAREPSTSSIYVYRDQNMDRKMDYLYDSVVPVLTQNNLYSNDAISPTLVSISGKLSDSSDGNYTFASNAAMSVLEVEDRVYWNSVYQPVAPDGSFSVFAVAGHTIEMTLWKVSTSDPSFRQNYEELLRDPVRLFEPSAFDADTVIHGAAGPSSSLGIEKITIRYSNDLSAYSAYPFFILAGQNPISIPLWGTDGSRQTGAKTNGVTALVFYFREFDRTTRTAGAMLDDSVDTTRAGYGAFFSARVFIDTNRDGIFNPGEPASGAYFRGDLNGNGIPDWGIVGSATAGSTDPGVAANGDYDDAISPSGIFADLDLDSATFLFQL